MIIDKCKKCRRVGEKLFLKGEKCFGPKCPITRKPYVPGIFGKTKRKRGKKGLSEYAIQLREKQKMKLTYGIRERQFANYLKEVKKKGRGDAAAYLLEILESRFDNVVFRSGLVESRAKARQIISHGHIMVNNRKVNIPSFRLKIGDKISIRPQSVNKGFLKDIDIKLKKYNPPSWIKFDKNKKEGEIVGPPATISS